MNKSVFVTGAAYGTGFYIAERFAKEGYNVFISGRQGDPLEEAVNKLKEYNVFAKYYLTSSFLEDEVKSIFEDIKNQGYLIDALVLNAANLGIG